MRPLGRLLAVVIALWCIGLSGSALATGRAATTPSIYAPGWRVETASLHVPHWRRDAPAVVVAAAWRGAGAVAHSTSDIVAEASRYVGSAKFTPFAGPWCADSISVWLKATGRPPLANRMAASALAYGPHVSTPKAGDLVVLHTRRGYAGHVGVVEGINSDGSIRIISGNWGGKVARGVISRRQVTAFVQT